MMSTVYQALAKLEDSGQSGVLCTIISAKGSTPRHEGSKMLVLPSGETIGTVGGGEVEYRVIKAALEILQKGIPRVLKYSMVDPAKGDPGICGGQLEIFIEPISPKNKLIIIGGGHVGREVAFLGYWLGFHVVVFDDRQEFSNKEAVPNAHEYFTGDINVLLENVSFDKWTYIVLTTRSVDIDLKILPVIFDQDTAYIGVIGSTRRWATTKKKLQNLEIPDEIISGIFSPIGIDLGAETPKEIALSILSEIIMVQRGGNALSISGADQTFSQQ